ncbi:MAG: hypothetical protein ACJAYU_000251 [Bradymonadia bacterium]|jgi:hypothetical protein
MAVPDDVYRTQQKSSPVERETFDVVVYCMLGFYKFMFPIFNLVPYIALRIVIESAGPS